MKMLSVQLYSKLLFFFFKRMKDFERNPFDTTEIKMLYAIRGIYSNK